MSWGALVLLLALAVVWAFRRGETRLGRLLGSTPGRGDRIARDALLLFAILAVVVAIAGPRIGTRELRVPASGLDVVVLLDLSRSMDAVDNAPNRLARARRLVQAVLARLGEGDRAALAIFAGQSALLTPLTPDKDALGEMLPALDTRLMADTRSIGGAGLEKALQAFEASGLRPKLVLVVSDGEVGRIQRELQERLVEQEVRVVAALVGTETGGRIPEHGRWMLDAAGVTVQTHRDVGPLASLLSATRGRAFLADEWGDFEVATVVREIRRDAIPGADGMIRRRVPVTLVALPAALGLLAICIEAWPGLWRRRRPEKFGKPTIALGTWRPSRGGAAALVLISCVLGIPEQGSPQADRPPRSGLRPPGGLPLPSALEHEQDLPREWQANTGRDPRAEIEARLRRDPNDAGLLVALGLERVRAGDAREAEHAFRAAALRARRPDLVALAWYDLGVLALEQGRLELARDAFFDASTTSGADPTLDLRVKFNLEWTLAALRSQQTPPPQQEAPNPSQEGSESKPSDELEESDEIDPDAETLEREREEFRETEDSEESGESQAEEDANAAKGPPTLDEEAARRWLDALQDDVRASIEAQLQGERKPGRGGPRW